MAEARGGASYSVSDSSDVGADGSSGVSVVDDDGAASGDGDGSSGIEYTGGDASDSYV